MIGLVKTLVPFARLALAVVAVSAISPRAVAQEDDGWFDAPAPTASGTSPKAAPAAASPAPDPRPPLAPSPLLARGEEQAPAASTEDQDPRALTAWNTELAPYGTWVDDGVYGRVWVPYGHVVGRDFAPYVSSGHWALDEGQNWIWVSDYPFGGVVFHYGRWVWTDARGWVWIPGLRYAPAWVAWRTGSYGYIGWAPLPPAWVWFGGVALVYGYGWYYPWVFCPTQYVFYGHVHHYVVRDHYHVGYAASHTRPYHPASPHPPDRVRAVPQSPTTRAANVPDRAVPRKRVSAPSVAARSPVAPAAPLRAPAPASRRAPGFAPERSTPAPLPSPAPRQRLPAPRLAPVERTPAPSPTRRAPRPSSFDIKRTEPRLAPTRAPGVPHTRVRR